MRIPLLWALMVMGCLVDANQHQALANASTYIANGNTAQINGPTDTGGTYCRQVTNNSGQTIFVPANISLEWSDFYTHPEPGVSIADCPPANCPGGSVVRSLWPSSNTAGFGAITNGNSVTLYFPSGSRYMGGGVTESWGVAYVDVTCNAGTNMITRSRQGVAPYGMDITPGNPEAGVYISADGQQVLNSTPDILAPAGVWYQLNQ